MTIEPEDWEAWYWAMRCWEDLGEHEKAVQHGERACQLEPNDPFSFTAMSVTYQRAFAGTRNQEYIHLAEHAMAKAHALQGPQW